MPRWGEGDAPGGDGLCPLFDEDVLINRVTRLPDSHHLNPFTGEQRADGVVGTRFNCLQCHVPQATAGLPAE